jgi:hypothetical protein
MYVAQTALHLMDLANPESMTSTLLKECVATGNMTKRESLNLLRTHTRTEVCIVSHAISPRS